MAKPQKEPLRELTGEERAVLLQLHRSPSERAAIVARAKSILAVSEGATFTDAAKAAGRRSNDAVARLVARFNIEGLPALEPRHGGGPAVEYGPAQQERILLEFRRKPDPEQDGTATWSLSTLQRALRTDPDGLSKVSTFTILETLHKAGYTWQEDRTWCETGVVLRKRKERTPQGTKEVVVKVTDPQATEKRG